MQSMFEKFFFCETEISFISLVDYSEINKDSELFSRLHNQQFGRHFLSAKN